MLNGKYLFIDIGSSETKIVEAEVKSKGITLLKTAEMRDMTLNIDSEGIIHSIELYCLSLKKTIQDAGIRTHTAIVCSSIFGIQNKDITTQFNGSLKECAAMFDKHYGRTTNYSVINDWQHLGNQYQEKTITQKIQMSSANITLLTSFVETMKSVAAIDVISMESSATALTNLSVLFPHSFDMPALAIVDLGTKAMHFKVFNANAFIASVDLKYNDGNLYTALAEKFNVVPAKMTNLAYNIGFINDDKNQTALTAGTIKSSEYFSYIKAYLDSIIHDVHEQLVYFQNTKKLGDIQVVFTGGLLSLPGVAEYIETNFNEHPRRVLSFDNVFVSKNIKITSKLNRAMPSKYNTCVGMMLRNFNSHPANLLPKELRLIDSAKFSSQITHCVGLALSVFTVISVICGLNPLIGWLNLKDVPEQVANAETLVAEYQDRTAALSSYIKNLQSIDNSLAPLIEFFETQESRDLKIASIDTASILNVDVDNIQDTSVQTSEDVNNIFNGLIIRGYATSSDKITDLYSNLKDYEYISEISMNGIKEVTLSEADIVYIFEMEVSLNDKV